MLPALIEPLPEIRIGPGIWVDLPPTEPERPCLAHNCFAPAAGHVMWVTDDLSMVCTREACSTHIALCKELGRCAVFPLDQLPPQQVVLNAINAEVIRRQGPPRPAYGVNNPLMFSQQFTMYATTNGGYFHFG